MANTRRLSDKVAEMDASANEFVGYWYAKKLLEFFLSLLVSPMLESTRLRQARGQHQYCRKIGSRCTILDRSILRRRQMGLSGNAITPLRLSKRIFTRVQAPGSHFAQDSQQRFYTPDTGSHWHIYRIRRQQSA